MDASAVRMPLMGLTVCALLISISWEPVSIVTKSLPLFTAPIAKIISSIMPTIHVSIVKALPITHSVSNVRSFSLDLNALPA